MAGVFREALEFLKAKKAVPKEIYLQLDEEARARAITVSGYTSAEVLDEFLKELQKAVEEGGTRAEFQEHMNRFLEEKGYEGLNPWKAETIFRTNLQTAYNAGHYKRMTSPNLLRRRPYWQYVTAGDSKVRESHARMEGRVYRADDPIWDVWYPPNGFKCRCTVVSLSEEQQKRRGIQVEQAPPTSLTDGRVLFPDKGFSANPARRMWKPDLSVLSPSVRKVYQEAKR